MCLTFDFMKTFELNLTVCCAVLKLSAYLDNLTFHDGEEE